MAVHVKGTCKLCKAKAVTLHSRTNKYCLDRCYGEMLQANPRKRPVGRPSTNPGPVLIVSSLRHHIPKAADACLTEIAATIPDKHIFPSRLNYMPIHPQNPTTTERFCAIVAKYDKAQKVLPDIKAAMPSGEIRIPRSFYLFGEEAPTVAPAAFSLIDYLAPTTEQTLTALQDLTQQMNLLANRLLLPKELLLAVTIYHARTTQLQKPTVSALFDIFRWVVSVAQETRIFERAATKHGDDAADVISLPDVQKLTLLSKYQRDLMGEIGGSPRAAKRLGMTSGDALSEFIDRAPRPGHSNGVGPRFKAEEEVERVNRLLALESTVGAEAVGLEIEAMPEAEVEEHLAETIAALQEFA